MQNGIRLSLITLLLSGCAPSPYKITEVPLNRKDVKTQTIDAMECHQSSQLNWPGIIEVLFCGMGAKVCQNMRDDRFERCMMEKGYGIQLQN